MTFRTRLLIAFLVAVVLPIIALALIVRGEMTNRISSQYESRVESLISVIEEDLALQSNAIAASLTILCDAAIDDNRFRRAVIDRDASERRYLLDYAGNAMKMAGLTMLQIQDDNDRIISSGHFRNEYDRIDKNLPELMSSAPGGTALVYARAPDEPFIALARAATFAMGGRTFTVVAGKTVERGFLERLAHDTELTVSLYHPGGVITSNEMTDAAIVRELQVPFIGPERDRLTSTTISVAHDMTELHSLRRSLDRWVFITLLVTVVLAATVVTWLASRMSRPLVELADKTARIDLDRLDIDFATTRRDEIGKLSQLLGAMTARLRTSAGQIKDAERRATMGELARQVNHDIKNGLTPIRNVFSHLSELSSSRPEELGAVFRDRRKTLESSISYLESLASNYARLTPHSSRRPCDVNEIVRSVVNDLQGSKQTRLAMELGSGVVVLGDSLSLRRVLENLVTNAIDSLDAKSGSVTIRTSRQRADDGGVRVQIEVADTGSGIDDEHKARIFDDFYTTREHGTGLGLSIVRRLVMDLDGAIEVKSEVNRGSSFFVNLPAADAG